MQTNNNSTSRGIHRYSLLDEEISDPQQESSDIEAVPNIENDLASQNQSLLHESSNHQEDHLRSKKNHRFFASLPSPKMPNISFTLRDIKEGCVGIFSRVKSSLSVVHQYSRLEELESSSQSPEMPKTAFSTRSPQLNQSRSSLRNGGPARSSTTTQSGILSIFQSPEMPKTAFSTRSPQLNQSRSSLRNGGPARSSTSFSSRSGNGGIDS